MELLAVVDYRSYRVETNDSGDDSDLPADPRLPALLLLQYVDARAKSRQLLHFIFSNFEMLDGAGVAFDGPSELYYPLFVQHVAALASMKKKGYKQGIRGARDCTIRKFDIELQLAIAGSTHFKEAGDRLKQEPDTFEWSGKKYSIRRLSTPIPCLACKWQFLAIFISLNVQPISRFNRRNSRRSISLSRYKEEYQQSSFARRIHRRAQRSGP